MREDGKGRQCAHEVEDTSKRLLSDSSAGVEARRNLVEDATQEPGLAGAHEACEDCHHIPQIQTAGLQSLVNDLLSLLVAEWSCSEEHGND